VVGAFKSFIFHQLTVKLAYWASNLVVSHLVAFLASEKFNSFIGPNSGLLIKITNPQQFESWLYLKTFALTSFLAVIAQHYFHEHVLLPKINPGEPNEKVSASVPASVAPPKS